MSWVINTTAASPLTIDVVDKQANLDQLVAQVKEEIFRQLKPEDHGYLLQSSRLLSLRDSNPSKCTGQSNILFNDLSVPRCWRARAGVYRAESLMILGFDELAKAQLIMTGRLLENDDHLQPIDLIDRNRHEILEGLVGWNIALGKINWGIIDPVPTFDLPIPSRKTKNGNMISASSKLFSAGYPSSASLSALDLNYC
ncbi:hypothetical protein MJO29_011046 [Puccinia striiformis f. sp. tritici]|uniref:Uncharacterized protein n=2 Tax=Puccinia striiformis TaxID=27350 RepID=A0A0L0VGK2_9BASI|nr:hypothetical protein Pst134EA_020958 [Puccinia striiformis f. sp. tritici]KNE98419.1 hypothetical protein PSTG_08334 [Puccinia striiformis f. sp. tritici PST-78]POW12690.1 hypothetical protein PSHT_08008 [Puccinia striiformis]KAH9447730.1 hypothetical protein Pst134EB_021732 [Puccinia striiformis f. sp. tritici]KAH9457059.1 hypothetical protein Pst134EA_020958 [Puccinia striiformis f. sp. tritici]KAI7946519.1 hypothetical protein MJO29_011046 [Puccinia striiformis f. sp. tritici]